MPRNQTKVDLIVKATAQGFEEVNKKQKSLGDTAEKNKSKFTSAKEGFGSFAKGVAGAGVALAATTIAMKKLFDTAAQGAAIRQQAESFDLLILKSGAVGDVFGELQAASKGTISDFEIMSSTATLLAGASGELATELTQATPELLEIAKAANKLNPALGSTTFLYESLARGVKRASPLILDNLGLVIKVGQANEAMAEKLGKSVGALTAAEKSQAILNETLRAGQVLIDQVGGNTDSATDSFAKMTTAIKNVTDTGKSWLSEFLSPAADVITLVLTASQILNNALKEHNLTMVQTADSYGAYVGEMVRAGRAAGKLTQIQADLILTEHGLEGVSNKRTVGYIGSVRAADLMTDALSELNIISQSNFLTSRDFSGALEVGTSVMDGHIEGLLRAEEAGRNFVETSESEIEVTERLNAELADLQILIGSDLTASYDEMIVKQDELQEKASDLEDQMASLGDTTGNAAKQGEFDELADELAGVQGEIAAVEAAWQKQTDAFLLNMIIQRASIDGLTEGEFDLITKVALDFGLIDQAAADAMTAVDAGLTDMAEGAGADAAFEKIMAIRQELDNISGEYHVDFIIDSQGGDPPPIARTGRGQEGTMPPSSCLRLRAEMTTVSPTAVHFPEARPWSASKAPNSLSAGL